VKRQLRLEDIKAAFEAKPLHGGSELKESDYKRKLADEVNRMTGGYAQRIEDKYVVGALDLFVKLPGVPPVFIEGKVIDGNLFGPTTLQHAKGARMLEAGLDVILVGWKHGEMFVSPWVEQADIRNCFTEPGKSYAEALLVYLS
jgi:hypothetical protein